MLVSSNQEQHQKPASEISLYAVYQAGFYCSLRCTTPRVTHLLNTYFYPTSGIPGDILRQVRLVTLVLDTIFIQIRPRNQPGHRLNNDSFQYPQSILPYPGSDTLGFSYLPKPISSHRFTRIQQVSFKIDLRLITLFTKLKIEQKIILNVIFGVRLQTGFLNITHDNFLIRLLQ